MRVWNLIPDNKLWEKELILSKDREGWKEGDLGYLTLCNSPSYILMSSLPPFYLFVTPSTAPPVEEVSAEARLWTSLFCPSYLTRIFS